MSSNKISRKNKCGKVINNSVKEGSHKDLKQKLNGNFLKLCIENSKRKDENNLNCVTENGICLYLKFE